MLQHCRGLTPLPMIVAAALLLTPGAALAQQNDAEDTAPTASEVYETMAEYTEARSEEFTAWAGEQYEQVTRSFQELDREATAQAKENWEAASEEFREQQAAVEDEMAELGAATGEAWSAARDDVVAALENLERAYHDVANEAE
jgi:hypothetical protein